MVRGNFQARLERRDRQRAAEKALKEEKKSGIAKLRNPNAVLQKLLVLDPDALIWLVDTCKPPKKGLCRNHFFKESCANRRCKYSHAVSISSFREPPPLSTGHDEVLKSTGDASDQSSEPIPALETIQGYAELLWPTDRFPRTRSMSVGAWGELPVIAHAAVLMASDSVAWGRLALVCKWFREVCIDDPTVTEAKRGCLPTLREERKRWLLMGSNSSRLRYAASKGMLAYDHQRLDVWRNFQATMQAPTSPHSRKLEHPIGDGRAKGESGGEKGNATKRGGRGAPWASGLPHNALSFVFALVESAAAASLTGTCVAFRKVARLDPQMRRRRREGLVQQAACKKAKRKTRQKGKGKKDVFARGQ